MRQTNTYAHHYLTMFTGLDVRTLNRTGGLWDNKRFSISQLYIGKKTPILPLEMQQYPLAHSMAA